MTSALATLTVLCALPVGLVGLLFAHELGHAVPVLATGGRAHITIGRDDGRTVHVGRLSITAGVDGLRRFFTYGRIDWAGVDSTAVRAASIAGGPIVSLTAIGVLGSLLLSGVGGLLLWVLAQLLVSESIRASQTIVPKTYSRGAYSGLDSDGKRLCRLLRSKPDER